MSTTPKTPDQWDGQIPIDSDSFSALAGRAGINTAIDYQYRDAGNYKKAAILILAGEITLEQLARIGELLCDGEFFLPERVGLNALNPWEWEEHYDDDLDHQLHEINDVSLTTDAPTTTLTVDELIQRFEAAHAAGWSFHTEDEFLVDYSLAP